MRLGDSVVTELEQKKEKLNNRLLARSAMVGLVAGGAIAVDVSTMPARAIDEIIVTAQKREQNILDVPVAVTALGSDLLERANIEDLEALEHFVPGMTRSSNSISRFARTFIRGVGSLQIATASDSSIGYYIDGVAVPRFAQGTRLFDLERVEVLKGPQGTLFGRSAQAGVINITTKRPGDEFDAKASIEFGSRDHLDYLATLSVPVSERFAFRVGAARKTQDGFLDNPVNSGLDGGIENNNISGSLYFDVSDNFTIQGGVQYLGEESDYPTQGAFRRGDDRVFGKDTNNNELTGLRSYLTMDWDFGPAVLTSVTGYYTVENDLLTDDTDFFDVGGFLPPAFANDPTIDFSDWFDKEREFSQELRLRGVTDSGIDWLFGANFFVNDYDGNFVNNDFFAGGGILDGVRDHRVDRIGYAVFADASVPVSEKATFSAGLRYSYEEQELTLDYVPLNFNFPGAFGVQLASFQDRQERDYDAVSGRAALSYAINDQTNLFLSYSRGYKPGAYPVFGLGTAIGVQLTPLNETKINAYEIGLKALSSDGRFGGGVSFFFNDVKDEQVAAASPANPLVVIFENADVDSFGVEFEGTFEPVEGLLLTANFAYTNSEIKTATTTIPAGTQFPRVPKYAGGAAVQYTIVNPVPNVQMDIIPRIDVAYVDERTHPSSAPSGIGVMDSYALVNGSLAFEFENFALSVIGENLFDEDYELSGGAGFFEDKFLFGDERQWFVKLSANL